MLASWGRVVHRLRWWLVALSLLPLALWLGVVPGERLDESVVPPEMESVRAVRILDEELAPRPSSAARRCPPPIRASSPRSAARSSRCAAIPASRGSARRGTGRRRTRAPSPPTAGAPP